MRDRAQAGIRLCGDVLRMSRRYILRAVSSVRLTHTAPAATGYESFAK